MVAFVKPFTGWRAAPSEARMAERLFRAPGKDLLLTDHALAFYGQRPHRLSNEEERRLLFRRVISWTLVGLIHVVLLSLFILDQIRERSLFVRREPVETILDLTKLPASEAPPIRLIRPEVPTAVAPAITTAPVGEQHGAILYHDDRAARDVASRKHVRQHAVEERRKIVRGEDMRRCGGRCTPGGRAWRGLRNLREGDATRARERERCQKFQRVRHGEAPSGSELCRLKVAISSPATSHAPPNRNVVRSKPVKMNPTIANPHSGITMWRNGRARSPRCSQKYSGTERF